MPAQSLGGGGVACLAGGCGDASCRRVAGAGLEAWTEGFLGVPAKWGSPELKNRGRLWARLNWGWCGMILGSPRADAGRVKTVWGKGDSGLRGGWVACLGAAGEFTFRLWFLNE